MMAGAVSRDERATRNDHPRGVGRPRRDANRLAHASLREQMRQGSTSRVRDTVKFLFRQAKRDLRLRGEMALERLRAYCPAAEAGDGRSARRPL
jgi:hypothetical protein